MQEDETEPRKETKRMKKWMNFLMVFLLSFLLAACGLAKPQESLGTGDTNKTSGVEGETGTDKNLGLPGEADTDKVLGQSKQEDSDKEKAPENDEPELPEDGVYSSKEDVAKYIHLYGHLPSNYITKKEAEELGWQGGSLEPYAPGKCIGGNRFGNYEGLLPKKNGRVYTECDIDTLGAEKRGAKRIVFSNDGLIYYTEDHYESFELLYGDE